VKTTERGKDDSLSSPLTDNVGLKDPIMCQSSVELNNLGSKPTSHVYNGTNHNERGSTNTEELCTKDPVNESFREGVNQESKVGCQDPLNESNRHIINEGS